MGNVQLREATLETTGVYLCEVSTESPNFETDVRLANLTVRGEFPLSAQNGSILFCCFAACQLLEEKGHVIFLMEKADCMGALESAR